MSQTRKVAASHSMLAEKFVSEEQAIAENQQQEVVKQKRLSDLKNLIFLGKIEEKVTIGGYEFVLQTLTSQQLKAIMIKIMSLPSEEQALVIKAYTLSYSIVSINGVPLEEVTNNPIEMVSNFQLAIIEKLWKKYEEISKKSEDQIGEDDLKK
jgi:hypothetical protein